MATTLRSDHSGRTGGRLTGWKEIGAHFGKSVRTAQRWEKTLALPVQRVDTGKGEVVFAEIAELDAWFARIRSDPRGRAATDASGDDPETPGAIQISTTRTRRWTAVGLLVATGLAVVAALVAYIARVWLFPTPYRAEVIRGRLVVRDSWGLVLWTRGRGLNLLDENYHREFPDGRNWILVEDLEDDGRPEILLIVNPTVLGGGTLICYEADGGERFRVTPDPASSATYADGQEYFGPWRGSSVWVFDEPGGGKSVWCSWVHGTQFPTRLRKLDVHTGNDLGEYWSNGYISAAVAVTFDGRPHLLVGAVNNESGGASLAVIDRMRPNGSAPSADPEFRCTTCPQPAPVAFLVFQYGHVGISQRGNPAVHPIIVDGGGQIEAHVGYEVDKSLPGIDPQHPRAVLIYKFDRDLRLIAPEVVNDYRLAHAALQRANRLDHALDADDERRELYPVKRWNGSGYDLITGPERASRRPPE